MSSGSNFVHGGKGRSCSAGCWMLLLFLTLLPPQQTCLQTCVSSCGKITNITHPFRLKGDPKNCGDKRYELDCVNNITVLQLYSGEFYVQSINYNNYTIRLVDPNIHIQPTTCSSLPRYFFYKENFTDFYGGEGHPYQPTLYRWEAGFNRADYSDLFRQIIYFNCTNPPSEDAYYVDTASCIHQQHIYAIVGDIQLAMLKPGCRVKLVALTSLWGTVSATLMEDYNYKGNISYVDIHRALRYGFELSWLQQGSCPCRPGSCYIDATGAVLCDDSAHYCTQVIQYTHQCGIRPRFLAYIKPYLIDVFRGFISIITSRHTPQDYYIYGGIITGRSVLPSLMAARILIGATFPIAVLIYRWRRRHLSMYENIETFLQGYDMMPIRYTYREINQMARGFKIKLGEGGFGSVYKGKLRSGPYVAIKMLGKAKANGQEFISEVATIGRIHHVNVVRLLGFCAEGSKRALVYEFMPNGSLDKHIFGKEGSAPLSYEKMYEISLQVARGIAYLHQGCDMQILHFDIKPYNILLDENFVPKISDFGLAKLYPVDDSIVTLTAARGTIGYMAPELFYKNIGGVSYKADVYSFGMLLMEMAKKGKNVNPHAENSSQIFFPTWIYDQFSKGNDMDLDDGTEDEKNIAKKMIIIALWCIQLKPRDRPSMKQVAEMLEGELEAIEMPPKPLLYPHETLAENQGVSSGEIPSDDSTSASSFLGETSNDVIQENCLSGERTQELALLAKIVK